jgi:hypothetical protein
MSNDQIRAAIANHRRAYAAWDESVSNLEKRNYEIDEVLLEHFLEASERLFKTEPTTIASTLTLLNYIIGKHDDAVWFAQGGVEITKPILKSIRKVLRAAKQAATG